MRKRHLLLGNILFLLLFVPSICFGVTFVSCQTGNWTDQTTWNVAGSGCGATAAHPDSTDTVTIANGTSVIVNESHNLGTCTVEGILSISSGVTATMNGTLTIGNGAGKEGQLTLTTGSEIDTNGFGLISNNAIWRSTSTSTSWAKIKGTGWVSTGAVYTGNRPKQDIDLSYVSFLNSGSSPGGYSVYFGLGDLGTIATNQAKFTHCTFNYAYHLSFGTSYYTANTTPIQFNYCDFRASGSTKKIYIRSNSDNTSVWVKNSTFYSTTYNDISIFTNGGYIEDSVFAGNFRVNTIDSAASSYDQTFTRLLISNHVATSKIITLPCNGATGSTLQDSYLNTNYENTHPVGCYSDQGAGTAKWYRNIFENEDTSGPSEWFSLSTRMNVYNNISLGIVLTYEGASNGYLDGRVMNIKNNTIVAPSSQTFPLYACWHHYFDHTNEINLVNNAVYGTDTHSYAVASSDQTEPLSSLTWSGGTATVTSSGSHYFVTGQSVVVTGATPFEGYNGTHTITKVDATHFTFPLVDDPGGTSSGTGYSPKHLAYVDYNSFYNVTTPYNENAYLVIDSGKTVTLTATDPQFVDRTRNLAKWNLYHGSGTDSSTDGVTYLLGINGYRGTPDYDQQGTVSQNKVGNLIQWVRYGFTPRNPILRKAGDPADGSPTIGAMEWQSPRRTRVQ